MTDRADGRMRAGQVHPGRHRAISAPMGGIATRSLRPLLVCCLLASGHGARAAGRADDAAYPKTGQTLAEIVAAMPKGLQRAEGPPLAASVAAAQAAVALCATKGAKVSILIADSAGEPVVMLSGDGAGVRSRLIAESKVAAVIRFRMPSEEAATKALTDHAMAAAAQADPNIGMLRGGGLPVMKDGRLIGAVAASGASIYGVREMDQECAEAALKILAGP